MKTILKMRNIRRHYVMPSGTVKALDGIDLEVSEGQQKTQKRRIVQGIHVILCRSLRVMPFGSRDKPIEVN